MHAMHAWNTNEIDSPNPTYHLLHAETPAGTVAHIYLQQGQPFEPNEVVLTLCRPGIYRAEPGPLGWRLTELAKAPPQ